MFFSWLRAHWFDLLQSLGIAGSLLFAASALRADARAKRVESLFTLTEQHRSIWEQLYSRPELSRILDARPNLKLQAINPNEELFVKSLILHLYTAYRAAEIDEYMRPEGLAADIRAFFSLPVPKKVWEKLKVYQDRDFVSYVDSAVASNGVLSD